MNPYEAVMEFHKTFEAPISNTPEFPAQPERVLRLCLLKEEYEEYLEAERTNNIVGVADALADMVYIIYGTAISYGIPLDRVFDEVHRSNMTKVDKHTGVVLRRPDGKIMKPASYEKPDIAGVMKL